MSGRFSHPLSPDRRFATSALALSHLQGVMAFSPDQTQAGVFEEDNPATIYRVTKTDGAIVTQQIGKPIREEPEMATQTTSRRRRKAEPETAEPVTAEQTESEPEPTPEPKASPDVDRAAYAKRLKPKVKKAFPSDSDERRDALLKYAVRMALHKDGLRTKPTDFARHGLTKEDVEKLAEIV